MLAVRKLHSSDQVYLEAGYTASLNKNNERKYGLMPCVRR